jgi:tetratricopeptide (TPR) repeat protein
VTFRGFDVRRTLVPRWRASNEAANVGELSSAQPRTSLSTKAADTSNFEQLRSDWKQEQTLETAADLVSTAVSLGLVEDSTVQQAARFVENSGIENTLRSVARRVLEGTIGRLEDSATISFDPDKARAELQSQISEHKRRVREYPKNALAWADLARLYASSGQRGKAHDSLRVATALAPNNRFVLRSAARFFAHTNDNGKGNDADEGLYLLRKSRLLKQDPWVMAAEISLSTIAGRPTSILKKAKALSDADSMQPWDLSELNGALATLAIEQGSVGKPGKLFNRSLRKPTENALAQAQWASDTHKAVTVAPQSFEAWTAPPFEALALKHRSEGNWLEVIADCRAWSLMEPTSTRPLVLGAFVAEVALENGETAREFSERARVLSPNAYWANNNLAVALAYMDKLDDAKRYAPKFQPQELPDEALAAYWATLGLIEYRGGNRETGLDLYLKAAETNWAKKRPDVRAMVMWHMLREEARIGAPGVSELAMTLWKRTDSVGVPELAAMRARIENPRLSDRARASALVRIGMGDRYVQSMQQRIETNLTLLYDHDSETK